MQANNAHVGMHVIVPDQICVGTLKYGGQATIDRIEKFNQNGEIKPFIRLTPVNAKTPNRLMATVTMQDGSHRQYYLKDVKPA